MAAGNGMMPPGDGWPKAEAAFKKAREIDPALPDAMAGMAVIQWMNRRDWAGAERTLRAILRNSSIPPEALLGRLLAAEGRFAEAIALGRKGIEVDPLSIRFSAALGSIFYYARRYEESVRQYRHALELDPNDVYVHQALGDAYERQGLQREAYREWRTALTLAGDNALAATLERAHQRGGFTAFLRTQASTSLEHFEKLTQAGQFVPAIEYARAYLRLGKKEQALQWLEKACDEHNIFVLYLRADPFYDELRSDARFQQLVTRIQMPE
jgi:tetratricopeptide (TPR) repeat protein